MDSFDHTAECADAAAHHAAGTSAAGADSLCDVSSSSSCGSGVTPVLSLDASLVAFNFATAVASETAVREAVGELPVEFVVEYVSESPVFAVLRLPSPPSSFDFCGRLPSGVLLYRAREVLGDEPALLVPSASADADADVADAPMSEADAEHENALVTSIKALPARVRRYFCTLAARGVVKGELLIENVQTRASAAAERYQLEPLAAAARSTLSQLLDDVRDAVGMPRRVAALREALAIDEKIGFVKDKMSAVRDGVQTVRERPLVADLAQKVTDTADTLVSTGARIVERTKRTAVVSWGLDATQSLWSRATSNPLVAWGVSSVASTVQWGKAQGAALVDAAVADYRTEAQRQRELAQAERVQSTLRERFTCAEGGAVVVAATAADADAPVAAAVAH